MDRPSQRESVPGATPEAAASAGQELDEAALIEGLRRQEPAAFEILVRRYSARLLAVARRFTGNDEDAKDCVQETLLQVHRKVAQFEGRSALGTWLHRIVVNAALSRLRGRRPEDESLDPLLPHYDSRGLLFGPTGEPPLSADRLLERDGTSRAVRAAIDQLPANYRSVLLLRDIEDYDTQETAEMLGISVAATKVRLHRARLALKALLEPLMREGGL